MAGSAAIHVERRRLGSIDKSSRGLYINRITGLRVAAEVAKSISCQAGAPLLFAGGQLWPDWDDDSAH